MGEREVSMAFSVGSQRSGTTWLARLLGAHPEVAALTEIYLVGGWLKDLYRRWDGELASVEAAVEDLRAGRPLAARLTYLPTLLRTEDFDEFARALVDRVCAGALRAKPSARVVLDSTPTGEVALAERVTSGARYLHIVRDPRAVVASYVRVSGSWWPGAPSTVEDAAAWWAWGVDHAMDTAIEGRFHQTRYEDLLGDPPTALGAVLEFLGVSSEPETVDDMVAAAPTGRPGAWTFTTPTVHEDLRRGFWPEPDDFGTGRPQPWSETLSPADLETVRRVAGATAARVGYDI